MEAFMSLIHTYLSPLPPPYMYQLGLYVSVRVRKSHYRHIKQTKHMAKKK